MASFSSGASAATSVGFKLWGQGLQEAEFRLGELPVAQRHFLFQITPGTYPSSCSVAVRGFSRRASSFPCPGSADPRSSPGYRKPSQWLRSSRVNST